MHDPAIHLPGPLRKNDGLMLEALAAKLPYVRAYAQDVLEVVHGPSCVPEREIRLEQCARDGVPIVARRGGGGTVVLAPGMVVVAAVAARPAGDVSAIYRLVHDAMTALLRRFGVTLRMRGISDLACGDRKVAGSSLYVPRRPAVFFYQCCLMVDCDLALLDRYLLHPPREPDYRAARSHGDFCTTLRREGLRCSCAEAAALFARELPSLIAQGCFRRPVADPDRGRRFDAQTGRA